MSYRKPDDEQHKIEHAGLLPGANRRRGQLRRAARIVAALAGVALLCAACGGGSAPTTAPPGSPGGSNSADTGVAFSQCMRAHGVPNFPDPNPSTPWKPFSGPYLQQAGVDPGSPQFQPASRACQHLMPQVSMTAAERQQVLSQALRYAACMRAHGVPDFPDPSTSSTGGVSFNLGPNLVNTPQFGSAAQACRSVDPGMALPTNLGKVKRAP
jgi:hypothetical protein